MSKTTKLKEELEVTKNLVMVFGILKDVAQSRYFGTEKRVQFDKFADAFGQFFEMVNLAGAKSPLIFPQNDKVWILCITAEGSFMANMISMVIKRGMEAAENSNVEGFIVVGEKARDKLKNLTDKEIVAFTGLEDRGLYETALDVKNYIVEKAEEGIIGKVIVSFPQAPSVSLVKAFTKTLLPAEELVMHKESEDSKEQKEVILESDQDKIIHTLADFWLTDQIYGMIVDSILAGFASQNQQLDSSVDALNKEVKTLFLNYRKSQKADIDKSLREVSTAALMTKNE